MPSPVVAEEQLDGHLDLMEPDPPPRQHRPAGSVQPATNETRPPAVALLSNGRYGVMVTAAGAGYSTWRGLDVTRLGEDATRDCWGQFVTSAT